MFFSIRKLVGTGTGTNTYRKNYNNNTEASTESRIRDILFRFRIFVHPGSRIPDPGGNKHWIPDPGSGSATQHRYYRRCFYFSTKIAQRLDRNSSVPVPGSILGHINLVQSPIHKIENKDGRIQNPNGFIGTGKHQKLTLPPYLLQVSRPARQRTHGRAEATV
jgi:hypothetical protein